MEKTRETNLPPASAGREIRRVCSREGWGAFLLMALTQVGAAVLAAALSALAPAALENPWMGSWGLTYLPLYLVAFPVMWLVVRRLPVRDFPMERRPLSPAALAQLWVFGMGVTYFLNYLSTLAAWLVSLLRGSAVMNPLESTMGHLPSALFFGVLVAPVMEEVIFRRILLRRLLPLGQGMAVYGSAFIFSLFHANLFQIPYAFVLGVMLAVLALSTGGIRASILLHVALNATGLVVMPLLATLGTPGAWAVTILVVAFMGAALGMLIRRQVRVPTLPPSPLGLTPAQERRAFLGNPGMIAYSLLILALMVLTLAL